MNFWTSLPQPIIGLAPMDGVTDAAFRLIVAQQGRADVSFTEFTNVGDICRGPDRMLSSLLYHECERPAVWICTTRSSGKASRNSARNEARARPRQSPA